MRRLAKVTARGARYFALAFVSVIALGLLFGCASADYHEAHQAKAYGLVQYCGYARCDGKDVR